MAYLTGEARAAYVRTLFGRIAPRYDVMNVLLSGGRDRAWRRLAVRETALPPGGRLLDVATGTGDVALDALRQAPGSRVVGVDFTLEMMRLARAKPGAAQVRWAGADARRLPFPDNAFDAVVSSFLLRNVSEVETVLAEQHRVVRPGGRVVCLEISRTPLPVFRELFRVYFYRLVPILGSLVGGDREAYTYLPHSLTVFLTPEELAGRMCAAGLHQVRYRRLMLGTLALHVGVKA